MAESAYEGMFIIVRCWQLFVVIMMTSSFEMSDSFIFFYWRIFLFKVILPS